MRRSSKSALQPASKAKRYGRKSPKGPNEQAINTMFARYSELGDYKGEAIDMAGICQLAEDLGIDPATDIDILILFWKLGAKTKPGHLMKAEWTEGMISLNAESVEKLKEKLPSLAEDLKEETAFREFFRFTFFFSREGTHRTIERDIAVPLLQMVMQERSRYTEEFVEFLKQLPPNTRITLDQWNSFLEFSKSYSEGLEGYDIDQAWPILLDEFVTHLRKEEGSGASGQRSRA